VQLFYLESLRLRARELPSLQFFRETLEGRLGMETEAGALAFSLVKHIGLAVIGCVTLALTTLNAGLWEALTAACLLVALYVVMGTHLVPQIVYRKTSGRGLAPLIPLFRAMALVVRPLTWGLGFLQSLFDLGGEPRPEEEPTPEEHIDALITAGEEEGIIEKGDREALISRWLPSAARPCAVMTPRPRVVAIQQEARRSKNCGSWSVMHSSSRIPAYEGSIDQITGFVHVRDMFELG
jgi:CBS domain containing-hemolysin-like protein